MPPTDANASRVFAQLALWFHCIADGENNLISKSTSLTIHGNSWFYTINQLALISKLGIWRFAQRIKLGGRRGSHIKHARAFVYQLCRQDWCSACYGGNVLCAAQISVMEANEGFLTTVSPIPHNLTAAPHLGKLCNAFAQLLLNPFHLPRVCTAYSGCICRHTAEQKLIYNTDKLCRRLTGEGYRQWTTSTRNGSTHQPYTKTEKDWKVELLQKNVDEL